MDIIGTCFSVSVIENEISIFDDELSSVLDVSVQCTE